MKKRTWMVPVTGGVVAALLVGSGLFSASLAADKGDPVKGKKVFERNCASCHGMKGAGDGPASQALNPKPRNYTKDELKFGSTTAALSKIVENGSPGTAMMGWKGTLKPDQIRDVVAYIRTLIPKAHLDKPPAK